MKLSGRKNILKSLALFVTVMSLAAAYVWREHLPSQLTDVFSGWMQLESYNAGHIADGDMNFLPSVTRKKDAKLMNELQGLWQEQSTRHFVRYTDSKDQTQALYIGCEWDEAEDVRENDLEYLGNGYFLWSVQNGQLTMIHLMDNNGAEIPKSYAIIWLTSTELIYKDEQNDSLQFSRVIQ